VKHPFPAGTRVRHRGAQWSEAADKGIATVVAAVDQVDGTWDYRVLVDGGVGFGLASPVAYETWWASYNTYPALDQPA
jgi:hypothetical protein